MDRRLGLDVVERQECGVSRIFCIDLAAQDAAKMLVGSYAMAGPPS